MGRSSSGGAQRVAIITGAACGIGRALAEEMAGRGIRVVLADTQVELAREVAEGIRAAGGEAKATLIDVRDAERFAAVVAETVRDFGRVDFLVNNAGIMVGGEARDFALDDWYDVLDVDLRGVVHGIHAVYPRMIEQGFGHIVNLTSFAGLVTTIFSSSYVAAKSAVVGITKALRVEAEAYGVRVSLVCPGAVRTPGLMGEGESRLHFTADREVFLESLERMRPMDPQVFARRVFRQLERNRGIIIVPGAWRLVWWMERFSPWLFERLTALMIGGARRQLYPDREV